MRSTEPTTASEQESLEQNQDAFPDGCDSLPPEWERAARAMMQAMPQLVRLDRYERRALSRRKRAIFALVKA
jgi:hypothetical protein